MPDITFGFYEDPNGKPDLQKMAEREDIRAEVGSSVIGASFLKVLEGIAFPQPLGAVRVSLNLY